ncbi:MAG: PAS domain S-box protein, partial [Gaiellaceae bacterium]
MSRLTLALGLALLVVETAVVIALVATSDHRAGGWTSALGITAGVLFVLSGLAAIWRRPENWTGVYLAAVGYLWLLAALWSSDEPWVHVFGIVVGGLPYVPFAALLLAYPTGRFGSRFERAFPLIVGVTLVSFSTAIVLFDSTPVPECEECPENPLDVVDGGGAGDALGMIATVSGVFLASIGVGLLVRRWRRAGLTLRRALLPVFVAGGATLAALVVNGLLAALVSEDAADAMAPVVFVFFGAVPLAFLFGILRTRLARSSVTDVVLALRDGTPLRDAIARALGDPSLEVVYRLEPSRGVVGAAWVDPQGRGVPEPSPDEDRAVKFIEQGGEPVAAVVYDAALAGEPELVDAVTTAAGLTFQNERLQAELRAEVRLAGTLADTAPSLLSNVDTDGRILKLNSATLAASGYSSEDEVRGKHFWDVFIDPEEREDMIARFKAAAPDFPPSEYENAFTNRRGERLVIYWHSAPVLDDDGRVLSIVAGGLDLTDRYLLEEEKRREREFLYAIANNAPSLICVIDEQGRVAHRRWDRGDHKIGATNLAFERLLEYEPGATGGHVFWERFVDPTEADEVRERIQRVVAGGSPDEHDNMWVTSSGKRLHVAWSCTPLPQVDERTLFLVSGSDVSERKHRELELQRARDFLQTVVTTIPSLLVVVDQDARIAENGVNREFSSTFGWSAAEATGRSFLELVHPEDDYPVRMAIAAAANGVARTDLEARWLLQDGEAAVVAWTATPTRDRDGRARVLL